MKKKRNLLLSTMLSVIFIFALFVAPVSASTGWKTGKARASLLNYTQEKIFDKAIAGKTGVAYMPVALLAKQTVNGTNYIYLAYGTTVSKAPKSSWYVVRVNKNGKKIAVKYIDKMTPGGVQTNSKPRKRTTYPGGLRIQSQIYQAGALTPSVLWSFDKATAKYTKYSLRPLGLLGYKPASSSGKYYRILCYGTSKNAKDIFVLTIHKKSNGFCKVTSCKPLDLEYYLY